MGTWFPKVERRLKLLFKWRAAGSKGRRELSRGKLTRRKARKTFRYGMSRLSNKFSRSKY